MNSVIGQNDSFHWKLHLKNKAKPIFNWYNLFQDKLSSGVQKQFSTNKPMVTAYKAVGEIFVRTAADTNIRDFSMSWRKSSFTSVLTKIFVR